MSETAPSFKFLGLTKTQWLGSLVTLLVAVLLSNIALAVQNRDLASQGVQAHKVECVYKGTVQRQYDQTRRLIPMTEEQRIKALTPQLGPKLAAELGTVPTSVLTRSAQQQKSVLDSLQGLDCS